ncbi:TetR/AcrR family transcriptional regulator [Actinomadura sp. 6N118]|uniref:TetR/AcrR family transcriptional regulator n=1 Tax=Actinomadura sp. 6N118 TaxID=3375151 RepID=UPI0037AFD5E0
MATDQPNAGQAAPARPLRRDAQRNRDALLAAARDCFAEHGLEAPLEQVAKRAGVAIGTLYRHFPTRLDLVQAIFAEKLAAWLRAAEKAVTMPDAWEGLCLFLETMCELQASDRGFNDLASMRLPETACLAGAQTRIHQLGVRVVERAHEQGSLRADLTPEDLAFVIWAHSRITEATHGIAPDAWRRHLHLMLDGFRAEHAHPLPVPPLTPDQLYRAMLRLGGNGACSG